MGNKGAWRIILAGLLVLNITANLAIAWMIQAMASDVENIYLDMPPAHR